MSPVLDKDSAGHAAGAIPATLRILMLEDSKKDAELCHKTLQRGGLEAEYDVVDSEEAFAGKLESQRYDLILADYRMPDWTGLEALQFVRRSGKDIPFIVVTGTLGDEVAVELIKAGVADYVLKDRLARLPLAVRRALEEKKAREEGSRTIDALRRSEDQLRQAQKMEAIGQLAGGVAHDFNNLLGVIIGYSEMLIDDPQLNVKARQQSAEIKKAGERAASLTRQLLAFSRQQVLEPRLLGLNSVVANTEKLLRRLIGENIDLRTSLDPMLGSVKADPGQIEQVIINLAVNARDAMPEGGRLLIETRNAELDEAQAAKRAPFVTGRFILLSVNDTGVGMSEDVKTHIFEPFFTTKELGKGTGLGLSTVYGVVKQSNGYIWVETAPHQGTTVNVYLPRVEEVREGGRAAAGPTAPSELLLGSEKILLVEDEEAVRKLTQTLLEEAGYALFSAGNGAEALALAATSQCQRIDLLLTDVIMPGLSRPLLAKRLAATHPGTRVLYMSGYPGSYANVGELFDQGIKLLQKPFSRHTLLRRVREVLDSQVGQQRNETPHDELLGR